MLALVPLVLGYVTIPATPSPELDGLAYASIHSQESGTVGLRVRGFVAVELALAVIETGPTLRLVGLKLDETIAPANATAQPTAALDPSVSPVAPSDARLLAAVLAR